AADRAGARRDFPAPRTIGESRSQRTSALGLDRWSRGPVRAVTSRPHMARAALRSSLLFLAGLFLFSACRSYSAAQPASTTTSERWAESTLRSLTLAQKAAQLVFVRAEPGVVNPETPSYQELLAEVR